MHNTVPSGRQNIRSVAWAHSDKIIYTCA